MHPAAGGSSPRCRTVRTSVWGHSHRSDSRRHLPCSRCWERNGHSVDQSHLAGSDTDRYCGRSDSRRTTDSWRARCPAGYRRTLRTRTRLGHILASVLYNASSVFIYVIGLYWSTAFSIGLRPSILTPAVLQHGVSIVTHFAALAGGPLAVVQAAQTLAVSGVAGLRVQHVNVVVALTGTTLSAHLARVSIVTR